MLLIICKSRVKVSHIMQTKVKISPVNMKERAELGIKTGDTVRVWQKIQEKGKTRLQEFEGLVLARKHGNEAGGTFTVRKVASGVGVEKIFPLYSPMIDKIEIIKRARVRRAKLYYIREKVARDVKRQLRKMMMMNVATESEIEAAKRAEAEEQARKEAEEKAQKEAEEKAAAEAAAAKEAEENAENTENTEETPAEEVDNTDAEAKEDATEEASDNAEKAPAEADDLTKIEGIGPKIAEVLAQNGITTFAQLADAKDEDTQEMIKDVKGNHRADTWNEQAALARDGKWDELKELQDKLDGGVAKDADAQEAVDNVEK